MKDRLGGTVIRNKQYKKSAHYKKCKNMQVRVKSITSIYLSILRNLYTQFFRIKGNRAVCSVNSWFDPDAKFLSCEDGGKISGFSISVRGFSRLVLLTLNKLFCPVCFITMDGVIS
uniref:Transposase n=1 Tax=Schistosoma curassoni TaxID=6186 RepID=A0A183KS72_9TREM